MFVCTCIVLDVTPNKTWLTFYFKCNQNINTSMQYRSIMLSACTIHPLSPHFTSLSPLAPCRLTLDEVAAAAEMILAQDEAAAKEGAGHESSDEGIGGEVDSDCECDEEEGEGQSSAECLLGDSGYGGQSMEELGADALLCLAGSSRSNTPPPS